jgi:hypothetical protein
MGRRPTGGVTQPRRGRAGVEREKALRGAIARAAGPGEGRYAEIFQVVDTS